MLTSAMRDFNRLWFGQTVSLLGSSLTMFAMPTLAVLVLHAAPSQVGALFALETLPFPILGLFIGVLADRVARRQIMIVSDFVRFIVLATIPVAAALRVLAMPQLYAVALIAGCASAFFGIAYQAYLPVIVATDRLTEANKKLEFSSSGSAMAGNALAGILIQAISAPAAIAVDAVSYLVSVTSLLRIRTEETPHRGPSLTATQMVKELREGIEIVFKSPDLPWILGATATTNFGGAMAGSVSLIYAYRILHLQPGPLGVIYGVASLGFIGALLSTRVRGWLGLRFSLVAALIVSGVAWGAVLFAMIGLPYVVLFLTSAIESICIPIYNVNQVSYRQALVDVRLQGRMNATMRTFVWGTLPLGSAAGGYAGGIIGIPQTILLGALLCLVAAMWLIPLRERVEASLPAA